MINKCKIEKKEIEYLEKLVDKDLHEAEDNLYRAKFAFKGQNLNEKYGQSNDTKKEIIEGYKQWYNKASETKRLLKDMK